MQLVIRVDLDKATQSLAEVFRLIGDCRWTDEAKEDATAEAAGPIRDDSAHIIGEWEIEAAEEPPHPLEPSYRAVATARYARPRQVEVDRFAAVSLTNDGAYVQGWLYVPRTDVVASDHEFKIPSKPPQSVFPTRRAAAKTG